MTRKITRSPVADMFDVLEAPDPDDVRREARKECKRIAERLAKLSRSSLGTSEPQLPDKQLLDSLLKLIQRYREISERSPGTPNYRIIREMCHRWPKYNLGKNLEKLIQRVCEFRGPSIIARIALACVHMSQIEKRFYNDRWRDLIHNRRKAKATDLEFMRPVVSASLGALFRIYKMNRRPNEALRDALAVVCQETLRTEFVGERIARSVTGHVLEFFKRAGSPEQHLRIQGFSCEQVREQIEILKKRQKKKRTLARVSRYRANKKFAEKRYTSYRHPNYPAR